MSHPEIDRLLEERSLVRERFDDSHVAGYWSKALAACRDASAPGLSGDGAFQLVYTCALQATLSLLASHDLRVKSGANHYRAFYSLGKLDARLRRPAAAFDALRARRHESIYEPVEDVEMADEAARATLLVRESLPLIREAILAARPDLSVVLALPPP